ncbi:MAG: endoglucanase [Clostridiales bacterium]|nr:endoglucanase [Clostridiales bacterium]
MNYIPYTYRNCPVPGGGYATGFLFHPRKKGLLYLRTDIGGTYRFDYDTQTWKFLTFRATPLHPNQAFPISLALDTDRPERLYIMSGTRHDPDGELAISCDCGDSFTEKPTPFYVHGNLGGRGTGERLIVDENDANTLWYASQQDGLWVTHDLGDSWQHIDGMPDTHLTFIVQVQGQFVVGAAGVATKQGDMRGPALYIGDGTTFRPMEQPAGCRMENRRVHGLAAQRWSLDDRYFYVTFGGNGPRSFIDDLGYSCDSGDNLDGHIVRYPLVAGGFGPMEDVTPCIGSPAKGKALEHIHPGDHLLFGFSGISASRNTPGMLIASTISKFDGDSIFLSWDHGSTWQQILFNLAEGDIRFRTSYMLPQYNGGESIIHWLSDLKLNPFDDNESWFNTGTGVFRSFDLTKDTRYYTDWSDGVEETVHLNVYGMPSGEVKVIDIIGDLGGFAFTDLDKACRNSFDDEIGNRYITCLNADFADDNPNRIVVTARGNWKGKTTGGLILTVDNAKTWRRLPMPWGLTDAIDEASRRIEEPNTNSGWVAMSRDGQTIAWTLGDHVELPVTWAVHSQDGGKTWQQITVYGLDGRQVVTGGFKIFADRLQNDLFYGFGDHSDLYISTDRARTFRQLAHPQGMPTGVHFARIDGANQTEIRGEAGHTGRFLVTMKEHGMWVLDFTADGCAATRLSAEGDTVFRAGYGLGEPGGDYINGHKAIYLNGVIGGEYGFYRTLDDGKTYTRLNTDEQMFGGIISLDGDCRTFGQFYLATGTYGLIYGKEQET